MKERLLAEAETTDAGFVAGLATERRAGHWLSGPGSDAADRRAVADAYDAIVAAAELFALHTERRNTCALRFQGTCSPPIRGTSTASTGFIGGSARRPGPALGQWWDLLKTLAEKVDRVYDQGFLQPLGVEWSRLLDEGFLGTWSLETLPAQQEFYATNIGPHLAESPRRRAFVIISDAFRYEAATELTETLNGRYRMDAQLSAMLGVLPSYTALGMASLLPHKTLAYSDKGAVLVDGKAVAGTEARGEQLATVEGMACQAKLLSGMKSEEAREFTQGKRVVYIYHNVIDAKGDSGLTESQTFEAVSDCIDELVELVQFCMNKLNAAKVWVTADHGFLFRQDAPGDTDKSKLTEMPQPAVKVKNRICGRPRIGPDLRSASWFH